MSKFCFRYILCFIFIFYDITEILLKVVLNTIPNLTLFYF